jgi:S-DNA-T family DNA segregation ATPase FtsK/SpoIIIE
LPICPTRLCRRCIYWINLRHEIEVLSADTLEYTSRLIERKLNDFGVEVKVVAAYPGPVITRYEIEPAVGVKGSQITNLVRDLHARIIGC